MNIDPDRYSPEIELNKASGRDMYRSRPFIFFFIFIALLILWSFFAGVSSSSSTGNGVYGNQNAASAGTIPGPGSGSSEGSGSGNSDLQNSSGNGSGDNGTGQGATQNSEEADPHADSEDNNSEENPDTLQQPTEPPPEPAPTALQSAPESTQVPSDNSPAAPPASVPTEPDKTEVAPEPVAPIKNFSNTPPAPPQAADRSGSRSGRSGFYGSGAPTGNKILFLVDVSGSMVSRMDELKSQLRKAIFNADEPDAQSYRRNGGFIIVTYSGTTNIFPASGLCRYRNRSNMRSAEKFINNLVPGGSTMMIPAWELSLDAVQNNSVDTIYFLSDGQPGDNFSVDWLLTAIKKKLSKKVTIHCISLGGKNQIMESIAKACGGTYVVLP